MLATLKSVLIKSPVSLKPFLEYYFKFTETSVHIYWYAKQISKSANQQTNLIFHIIFWNYITYTLKRSISRNFKLKSGNWNDRKHWASADRTLNIRSIEASYEQAFFFSFLDQWNVKKKEDFEQWFITNQENSVSKTY